jgi:hypothetical protein
MPIRRVTVHPVPGVRQASRALAYLVIEGDDEIAVWSVLQRIYEAAYEETRQERRKVWSCFESWLRGDEDSDLHHGWADDPAFRMGYVFRWDHQRQHRRLYGFLTQPRPDLEMCVLCCYRSKDRHKTEAAVKAIVKAASRNDEVREAIKSTFSKPRKKDGAKKWTIQ